MSCLGSEGFTTECKWTAALEAEDALQGLRFGLDASYEGFREVEDDRVLGQHCSEQDKEMAKAARDFDLAFKKRVAREFLDARNSGERGAPSRVCREYGVSQSTIVPGWIKLLESPASNQPFAASDPAKALDALDQDSDFEHDPPPPAKRPYKKREPKSIAGQAFKGMAEKGNARKDLAHYPEKTQSNGREVENAALVATVHMAEVLEDRTAMLAAIGELYLENRKLRAGV